MASPPAPLVTDDEINSAPDDVIRAALLALCRNDAALRTRVSRVFRVAVNAGQKRRKADEGEAVDEQELPEARRQKLEGLRVCIMCEKAYLESENGGEVCWHHPEESEMDDEAEVWSHWEETWGDMDTPDTRKDMPEAFRFPCCDNNLTSTGCTWGRHYATIQERDSDPERKETWGDVSDTFI